MVFADLRKKVKERQKQDRYKRACKLLIVLKSYKAVADEMCLSYWTIKKIFQRER